MPKPGVANVLAAGAVKQFGERLRLIRSRMGLTQAQFAKLIGAANRDSVMRLECGHAIQVIIVGLLAIALVVEQRGISPMWLLTGHGAMEADSPGQPRPQEHVVRIVIEQGDHR